MKHIGELSLYITRKLAEEYVKLLKKLEKNVENMIEEGVATKGDALRVKVKLNEAEVLQKQIMGSNFQRWHFVNYAVSNCNKR